MSTEANAPMPASKRRILLIIPYGGVGGMERLAWNMYRHYRDLGDTVKVVKVVGLENDIVNFGEHEIVLSRLDLVDLSPVKRYWFYLSIPLAIARVVRKHGITHSIAFGDVSNLFSSLSPSREFKVASIHSLKSVELAGNTVLNRLTRLAYRSTYRRFKRVVCISRAIRDDLVVKCRYTFPQNLDVIYNPHDVSGIQQAASEELDPQEKQLFSRKTVVFLGRLTGVKAPWHLIKAFRALLDRGVQARLLMIGDGDPVVERNAKSQVARYGIGDSVSFLGRRSNPYKYLARADLLALSSHFEGTPNVIVEAIALGVPVVSSHCTDGIIELMDATGARSVTTPVQLDAGILTPPLSGGTGDTDGQEEALSPAEAALADALDAVLGDPSYRTSLILKREQLLKKFDLAISARAYLALPTQSTEWS